MVQVAPTREEVNTLVANWFRVYVKENSIENIEVLTVGQFKYSNMLHQNIKKLVEQCDFISWYKNNKEFCNSLESFNYKNYQTFHGVIRSLGVTYPEFWERSREFAGTKKALWQYTREFLAGVKEQVAAGEFVL